MPDREKVLKGLEMCTADLCEVDKSKCPYCDYDAKEICIDRIMLDALALLKQEAVAPYIAGSGESFETAETWWYECGKCNKPIDPNDKFCRHCGRAVKWE